MSGVITLVLGGARSGKSAWAERLAAGSGRRVLYLATARAGDDEMAERIAIHRAGRPAAWRTVEAPDDLPAAVLAGAADGETVLVDCLTLWVSNFILNAVGPEPDADTVSPGDWVAIEERLVADAAALVADARQRDFSLVLVSNEVGMGLVPPYPLGRRFRDILGRVNQAVASRADWAVLMVAGLPVDLRRLAPALRLPDGEDGPGRKQSDGAVQDTTLPSST